ncbi:MAG: GAF domain-containing protein [Gemmatimonadota bacterium]|nr:GAF domain-containing protein [Gemmatimonadota bacterium]
MDARVRKPPGRARAAFVIEYRRQTVTSAHHSPSNLPQSRTRPSTAEAGLVSVLAPVVDEVGRLLKTAGVLAALGYLNARVRFRYTGIFHPEPPMLRNVSLFDRENPRLNVSGNVIPLVSGYCGIVYSTNGSFATPNAQRDPRLCSHPARSSMRSYAGVPISVDDGSAWGTLCHFDMRPRVIPPTELPLLELVAPFFADWVREHADV